MDTLSFLKESIFSDDCALKKGFLQSIEPPINILTLALFLVSAIFTKSILTLICLYLICLLLAYFSRINLGFFLKRTWIFIPLFSIFIAIPALFSVFTPGESLFIFNLLGIKFIITRQGFYSAILFVLRVLTSVSLAVLLGLTTRHFALLRALRIFKIPLIFVMTLGMCYRYIYLFIEIIENRFLAIKSRVGGKLHYQKGQRIVAWNITSLWQRSSNLNEEVYKAMLSRGYNGETYLLDEFKTSARDWLWLFSALIIFSGVIILNG